MNTEAAYDQLERAIAWTQENLTSLPLIFGRRRHLVLACYDVAMEHMAAVALLYRSGLHGSMLSLLRSLFESVVRGMWLDRCASEGDLERFRNHKLEKSFGKVVREIESTFSNGPSQLSIIHANTWPALNGYTHTGYNQVVGRHGEEALGAAYGEKELRSALNFAAVMGMLAAGQMADAANKPEVVASAAEFIRGLRNAA